VGGGTTGSGTVSSANYVNFNNLTLNSGTWTLQGPVVSGNTTLNGGGSCTTTAPPSAAVC
jgi:hypothetical protein